MQEYDREVWKSMCASAMKVNNASELSLLDVSGALGYASDYHWQIKENVREL